MFPMRAGRSHVRKSIRKSMLPSAAVESLEDRILLSAFTVSNLNDSGGGSLRQAILNANAEHGADTINFTVAGTIVLNSALPNVTDTVNIDGTSAPGFSGAPVVEVNFNGQAGLTFTAKASGSELQSLALVDASGNGVTLNSVHQMLIVGNFVGVETDGVTAAANQGSGIELINSSGNTIGGTSAQDRNIVSANLQQGILVSGSSSNIIMNNYIGTNATGTAALGNGFNGVLITGNSKQNLVGGEETGGNDPTQGVFDVPPEGNLISGNGDDGVLINNHASQNQLSGNFIGTDVSGNVALGNGGDGVSIQEASNNSLLGCTIQTDPFVFYNVISGNGGNGLSVINSNNTTIQANFFGMGANNDTAVGNALNGVVIEGTSSHTTMGGPIPLGNVDAANGQNGIVVQDHASYFTSYNTFCGLAAFSTDPDFGNGADGMLLTSTGGDILIRTNVITENGHDGIEIGGAAQGIHVTGNIIGLDTNGQAAMGNVGNGVEVDGTAHNIVIGGPQPTFNVIPQNTISANGGNGVAITGAAHNITVNNGFIGTNVPGLVAFGNDEAGIYLGPGTSKNTIGSTSSSLTTVVSANGTSGIDMQGSNNNTVIGTWIGTDRTGTAPLGNSTNGILLNNSSHNTIGGTAAAAGNRIAYNDLDGVFVESGTGNGIHENSIFGNGGLGIDLGSGANLNQATPMLTSLQTTGPGVQVLGTLYSTPKTSFTIEFFASSTIEPSSRVYLGKMKVTTNAAGTATITSNRLVPPVGASFITATATDPGNNTSALSNSVW
jgi:parallel beta-helix repeat protein